MIFRCFAAIVPGPLAAIGGPAARDSPEAPQGEPKLRGSHRFCAWCSLLLAACCLRLAACCVASAFQVLRDLHNLQSGLVVLKSYFSNSTALRLKRGSAQSGRASGAVLMDDHMPFLRDLDESVKWVKRTIESHEGAIQVRHTGETYR